jgi:hypothetical protein
MALSTFIHINPRPCMQTLEPSTKTLPANHETLNRDPAYKPWNPRQRVKKGNTMTPQKSHRYRERQDP